MGGVSIVLLVGSLGCGLWLSRLSFVASCRLLSFSASRYRLTSVLLVVLFIVKRRDSEVVLFLSF